MTYEIPAKYIKTKADELSLRQGCYFDQQAADRVIAFAEKYFNPQFIQGDFKLLEWQKDWLANLYGWKLPDGRRRYRKALLTVAKKNGKSLLCAIVALYESLASGNKSPLVVSCSTTRSNASQIFDEVKSSVKAIEKNKKKPIGKVVPSQKIIKIGRAHV